MNLMIKTKDILDMTKEELELVFGGPNGYRTLEEQKEYLEAKEKKRQKNAERYHATKLRSIAKMCGINFYKSRKRIDMVENCGGYQLCVETEDALILVDGACFEMTLEEVSSWLQPAQIELLKRLPALFE
ncbi:hypothetical protein [Sinorhizobium meliloti]|uniref:hypothetical protein n=1 Tax=Rhizobium meliloti TaxID=382 RepID=UPI000FD8F64C|nr:hypothetical protein [Sinorhizobium meliloti]RVM19914.1 hypothetical protein CN134_02565 [Sinorhizobium meliloti]RVO31821.1 hypothetical protein CN098_11910 [Sinorhizobium meliloti]